MRRRIGRMAGAAIVAAVAVGWWAASSREQPPAGAAVSPADVPGASRVALPVRDVDVVMVGDSLTEGGDWAAMFDGIAVANRGVGGRRARDVSARMDDILATQPEVAFVMVGVNDLARGLTVEETFADYIAVVDALAVADVDVVIQSTVECRRAVCGNVLDAIRELNGKLAALADERGLVFVDLNRTLSDDGGLRAAYTYDGTHLNADGYRLWADAVSGLVREKVSRRRDTGGGSADTPEKHEAPLVGGASEG